MKRTIIIPIAILVLIASYLTIHNIQTNHRNTVETLNSQKQLQVQENVKLEKQLKQREFEKKELEKKNQEIQQQKDETDTKNKDLEQQLVTKRETQATLAAAAAAPAAPEQQVTQVAAAAPSAGCESYRTLFEAYDWNVTTAMAIMQAESGCNPSAVSPTNDHGLMQINQGLQIYGAGIYDPATNIRIAYTEKYQKGGWGHWSVYNSGSYAKYL
jgi:soluble lytic murein transglycosylase-like protein